MPREVPARDAMTTDVVSFLADQPITEAMQQLVDRGIDAGPVLDAGGKVIGMLSTGAARSAGKRCKSGASKVSAPSSAKSSRLVGACMRSGQARL